MMQHLLLFSSLILLLANSVYCQHNFISGDMLMVKKTDHGKASVKVSKLSEGDVIPGINGPAQSPAWCRVEAIFEIPNGERKTTYDGFSANHLIVDQATNTVHSHGEKGQVHIGPVYTLATDCGASVNAAGQAFTPISAAFCGPTELSWSEYLTLIAAVRRVTGRTGNFWFDLKVYHDNDFAKFPRWMDQLPELCGGLLQCAQKGQCQDFENVAAGFVYDHLNQQYLKVVKKVFPNMGSDVEKELDGTITEVVRPKRSSHDVPAAIIALRKKMALGLEPKN